MTVKKLLNSAELAERLGVKENTIRQAVMKGNIPSIKIGRCRRFDEDEMIEFFRKGGAAHGLTV